MTTYERITYREDGARRSSTVILRDPHAGTLLGHPTVSGIVVNTVGDEVASDGADERIHIIDASLVTRRTALRMSRKYASLVDASEPEED